MLSAAQLRCSSFKKLKCVTSFANVLNVRSQHVIGDRTAVENGQPANFGDGTINFDNKMVFEHKDLSEVVRAMLVLKMCSFDNIVNNGEKLMTLSKRLLGNGLYAALQKRTFYGQFIAGNTPGELLQMVHKLRAAGIGPLLAVPMEDDAGSHTDIKSLEEQFDKNLNKTLECLDIVAGLDDKIPMMQIKLTALMSGDICTKLSSLYPNPSGGSQKAIEEFASFFSANKLPMISDISLAEYSQIESGLHRLRTVLQRASELNIWILVDAEYTYMNPALNLLTLAMMLSYNANSMTVGYTYQNYLKDTTNLLKRDISFIQSQGTCIGFSAKLVRGAYLEKERMLAKKLGYPCPVNDTYEDTTRTYHNSFDVFLDTIVRKGIPCRMMVASHNEDTVKYAEKRIKETGINKTDGSVLFGQVQGMSDHVSYALGQAGYLVYKSLPYGSIDETLPYMLRRLLENRSILNGIRREQDILKSSCKHKVRQKCRPF